MGSFGKSARCSGSRVRTARGTHMRPFAASTPASCSPSWATIRPPSTNFTRARSSRDETTRTTRVSTSLVERRSLFDESADRLGKILGGCAAFERVRLFRELLCHGSAGRIAHQRLGFVKRDGGASGQTEDHLFGLLLELGIGYHPIHQVVLVGLGRAPGFGEKRQLH